MINLKSVFVINGVYPITSLPRSSNDVWGKIPDLSLNDEFVFTGTYNAALCNFKHIKTGITHAFSSILFLNSDRYYQSPLKTSTALFVACPTNIIAYNNPKKRIKVSPGTIFTSFENTSTKFYLVTTNTGEVFQIYKSAVRTLADIEHEELVKDEVKEIKEVSPIPISSKQSLEFTRSIVVNGFEFSTEEDAKKAETFVIKMNELLNSITFSSTTDTENALALAKSMGVMI